LDRSLSGIANHFHQVHSNQVRDWLESNQKHFEGHYLD
jgi:hypothetical protein